MNSDPNNLFSFMRWVSEQPFAALALYGLVSARFLGVMLIMPLFTRAELEGSMRFIIAVGLATPLGASLAPMMATSAPPPSWLVMMLAAKELVVGVGLGIVFAVPIWAINTAGDIIDSYRNASAANISDPVNSSEMSVFGTYLAILGLALFVAAGGVQMMISATYRSFAVWPVQSLLPALEPWAATHLLSLLTDIGRIAFIVAAPLLVLMLAIDITMLAFNRMNPQFQVFESSNSLKNLALVIALPLYVAFFTEYMNVQWPKLFTDIDRLVTPQ